MKKNFNELSNLELQIVSDFISNPRKGFGIETVVLTAEGSYVVFSNPEDQDV